MRFELLLSDNRVVSWEGSDGVDASVRYADAHPGGAVAAWREIRHGVFVGSPGRGSD